MTQVHRLTPRAAFLLDRMARSEGRKPSAFLSDLVVAYAAGLSFDLDPDLDRLAAPHPESPAA